MAKLNPALTNKTKWDLTPLFARDDDPKMASELKKVEKESYKFINKWKKKKDYLLSPKALKRALDEYEVWARNYGISGKLGYYLSLRSAQELTNPKIKAKSNKLHDISLKIVNDIQFFELSLAKIAPKTKKKMLKSPLLKEYKHLLEKVFESGKYKLSDAEEKILNLKEKTSYGNWIDMVSEFISKEERLVLNEQGKRVFKPFNEILSLISSQKKSVRKSAAKAVDEILEKHLDVAEVEINTVCENIKVRDQLRGYDRPDKDRHLGDDMDSKVVDTLVRAVSDQFSVPKKYYKFKAKLLKQKSLDYFEKTVEYGKLDQNYPYKKAMQLVYETFSDLDGEFAEILQGYLANGQIDVYPKKGKAGGAFCAHSGIEEPTYILLNHTNKLMDVMTIAHELGHGINNELIKQKQNALNFGTPTSTAEVASTFMEDFVLEKLMRGVSEEEELAIRMHKLDSDISSIYRQIAFYKFETDLHHSFREKGYLTKHELGKMFKKHMQSYLGPTANGSENWWLYVSHFRALFYVYSYSSGLLISKALQAKVKKNPEFINEVKEFLSAGHSDSPKNLFAKMGIDISRKSFWDKGLSEIDSYLSDTIKLAKKLGKV